MEQTNQYIKQFPTLFEGKKILYVHGFGSSGQSGTVTRMREVLPQARVIAPDLPIHPKEAVRLLHDLQQIAKTAHELQQHCERIAGITPTEAQDETLQTASPTLL